MGDLTAGAGRLWMAIDGLRRRDGDPKRKKPVTPRMMRWIRRKLQPEKSREGAALWAAVAAGYFFLLRASEYVSGDQNGYTSGKGLRGADVTPKAGGEPTRTWTEANEVVIKIRASKTDQYNRGEWRNHFRIEAARDADGDEHICVVEALTIYEGWARERFSGAQ
eukprot:9498667-Pyramimonas_sp.AAC.1